MNHETGMNQSKNEEKRLGSEPAGMVKSTVRWALAAGFLAASSLVSADCACFCMNGELQTMCTSVEEAQADPALCPAYAAASCPIESATASSVSYDAPEDGASNCRDVRVWNSIQGAYVSVKACDVAD